VNAAQVSCRTSHSTFSYEVTEHTVCFIGTASLPMCLSSRGGTKEPSNSELFASPALNAETTYDCISSVRGPTCTLQWSDQNCRGPIDVGWNFLADTSWSVD
jgi:hypothetical protein